MAQVIDHSAAVKRKVEAKLMAVLIGIASDMTGDIKQGMKTPKSGTPVPTGYKTYSMKKAPMGRIPGWGTTRSAPGESPAVQTGRLWNAVKWARAGHLTVRVGTNVKYGRWLEEGVRGGKIIRPTSKRALSWVAPDGARMVRRSVRQGAIAPRPWLSTALDRARASAEARIKAAGRL